MAKETPSKKSPAATKTDQPNMIGENTTLELVIPSATTKRAYQQALAKFAKSSTLKGFRKGKVPLKMAEEIAGEESIINQALDQILPAAYQRLMNEQGKASITDPEFKLKEAKKDQDWTVEVVIAEKPEVKLGDYQKAVKSGHTEAAKIIKEEAARLAENNKTQETDKKAQSKNSAEVSAAQVEEITLQTIFKHLLETAEVPIPELLLKNETRQQLDNLVHRLDHYQLSLDDYLARQQITFEQLTSQIAAQALANLQLEFILESIGLDQKIEVTEEELSQELKDQTQSGQVNADNPYLKDYLKRTLHRQKVLEFLKGK